MTDGRRWGRVLVPLGLLLVPVAAAYGIIFRFAINIPYIDDYWNALDFALQYERLNSLGGRLLNCLVAQQDAYKFVFLHAVVTAEMLLTGHVNMVVLSAVGDLMIVGLLAMLCRLSFRGEEDLPRRLWLFVPIAYLLFRLNYWEGIDWVSSSLDYVPAMLFSLVALHLLCGGSRRRPRVGFAPASFFALLAYFTAPNAVLLAPLGLLVLIRRKAYGQAVLWCAVLAVGLSPYLFHYNRYSEAEADSGKTSVKLLVSFFLSFLGSGTPWQPAAILVGLGILAVFVWAWRTGFYGTHPALMLYGVWLLGSAAMVAAGRSHSGVAYSLAPRYRLFSDQLLILCFVFVVERLREGRKAARWQRQLYGLAVAAAMAICIRADMLAVKDLGVRRAVLLEGLAQFEAAPGTASPMYFREAEAEALFSKREGPARSITIEAIRQGIYLPPVPLD